MYIVEISTGVRRFVLQVWAPNSEEAVKHLNEYKEDGHAVVVERFAYVGDYQGGSGGSSSSTVLWEVSDLG